MDCRQKPSSIPRCPWFRLGFATFVPSPKRHSQGAALSHASGILKTPRTLSSGPSELTTVAPEGEYPTIASLPTYDRRVSIQPFILSTVHTNRR
eukprot:4715454-Pyramimonas_sp.AAC.1